LKLNQAYEPYDKEVQRLTNLELEKANRFIIPEMNWFKTEINYDNFTDIVYKNYLTYLNILHLGSERAKNGPFLKEDAHVYAGNIETNRLEINIVNDREFIIESNILFWNGKKIDGKIKFDEEGQLKSPWSYNDYKIVRPVVRNEYNTKFIYEEKEVDGLINKLKTNEDFYVADLMEETQAEKNQVLEGEKYSVLYLPIRNYDILSDKEVFILTELESFELSTKLPHSFKGDYFIRLLIEDKENKGGIMKWKNIKKPFAIYNTENLSGGFGYNAIKEKHIPNTVKELENFLLSTKHKPKVQKIRMERKLKKGVL
jgi:hypothetical protein